MLYVLSADGDPCEIRTRILWLRAKVPGRLEEGALMATWMGLEPTTSGATIRLFDRRTARPYTKHGWLFFRCSNPIELNHHQIAAGFEPASAPWQGTVNCCPCFSFRWLYPNTEKNQFPGKKVANTFKLPKKHKKRERRVSDVLRDTIMYLPWNYRQV